MLKNSWEKHICDSYVESEKVVKFSTVVSYCISLLPCFELHAGEQNNVKQLATMVKKILAHYLSHYLKHNIEKSILLSRLQQGWIAARLKIQDCCIYIFSPLFVSLFGSVGKTKDPVIFLLVSVCLSAHSIHRTINMECQVQGKPGTKIKPAASCFPLH